jgi:hypothetical protein
MQRFNNPLLLLWALLLFHASMLHANESDQQLNDAQSIYFSALSAAIALTSDEDFAAGQFFFDAEEDQKNGETWSLIELPLTYQFEPFAKGFNAYAHTSFNRFYSNMSEPGEITKLKANLVKVGGGLRYTQSPLSYIEAGYNLIYTWVNLTDSDPARQAEFNNITKGSNSTWSNEFIIHGKYGAEIEGFIPYADIKFSAYNTTQQLKNDFDVDTSAQLFDTALGLFSPTLAHLYAHDMIMEGYVERTYFYGDVKQILEGNHFNVYGLALHFPYESVAFNGLYDGFEITSTWTEGDNFHGYSFGIGFNAPF